MPFIYCPPFPLESADQTEGRLDIGAIDLPPSWQFDSEDQAERFQKAIVLQEIDEIKYFSERYDIASYVSLNQIVTSSLTDWLGIGADDFIKTYGLPNIIKKALAHECAEVARQIQQKRKQEQDELNLAQTTYSSNLDVGKPNASFNRTYG